MFIDNKFPLDTMAYLKSDDSMSPRLIIRIAVSIDLSIIYTLVKGTEESFHYEQEIVLEPTIEYTESLNGTNGQKK